MAFSNEFTDQIQHVNLSGKAYDVIMNDIMSFSQNTKLGTFLNKVFTNFRDEACSSISIALIKEEEKIKNIFNSLPTDVVEKIKTIWIDRYRSKLCNKSKSYKKGKGIKFRINNENFEYLTNNASECKEEKYYKERIGLYLKAVFEEYAEKPIHIREQIYFEDKFSLIREAIKNSSQLKILVANGKWYYVRPYEIGLATYYYLSGLSVPAETADTASPKIVSFRISRIDAMRLVKSRSGYLTEADKKNLQIELRAKGLQFLADELSHIKIKLTEAGIRKYNSQLHLRPDYVKPPMDNIYSFDCTLAQAEYYFFKFGKDAEIISPEQLKEKFKNMYSEAMEVYKVRK